MTESPESSESQLPSDPGVPVAGPPPESIDTSASFTGEGAEYFKIWIVNVALSIATLGIYSAWAKVRRLQYFYRNTRLADASFDYHGDPIAILKGRLIAAVLFGLYSLAGVVNPLLAIAVFAVIAVAVPWLARRSLAFRLHNSSYRGLRFRFGGTTRSAYWVYLALPILMVLSLGTLLPFWQQRTRQYQYGNTSYGRVRFALDAPVSEFYLIYLAAMGLALGLVVLVAVVAVAISVGLAATSWVTGDQPSGDIFGPEAMVALIALFGVVYLVGITAVQVFVTARMRNLVWNGLTLGSYRFVSDLAVWPLLRITLGNLAATVVTLGLFWPFAQVRLMRYLISTIRVQGPASFDEFTASTDPDEQAVGEEISEFFDVDVGF